MLTFPRSVYGGILGNNCVCFEAQNSRQFLAKNSSSGERKIAKMWSLNRTVVHNKNLTRFRSGQIGALWHAGNRACDEGWSTWGTGVRLPACATPLGSLMDQSRRYRTVIRTSGTPKSGKPENSTFRAQINTILFVIWMPLGLNSSPGLQERRNPKPS